MAGLGNPLCHSLGGGPSVVEQEHQALLDASPMDPTDPMHRAMAWGEAVMVANVWAVDTRLKGLLCPPLMMESLPVYEEACSLTVLPGTSDNDRRGAVAACFAGLSSNALAAVEDACSAIAGSAFVGLTAATSPVVYAPGLNPGPAGYSWSGTNSVIGVKLNATGLVTSALLDLIRRLRLRLKLILPAWNVSIITTANSGFVAGIGVVGLSGVNG
jgi:hypothetical protein